MKLASDLRDHRIDSRNILVDMSIGKYVDLAREIIHKNEFQRKRVRSSKTVYALLKQDLQRGCVMPPIVLALTSDEDGSLIQEHDLEAAITGQKDHLVILDGLQRTYTLIELLDDLTEKGDEDELNRVRQHIIRVEFYVGINRLGILYRMLTLNTGQTPMSLRQQIEILYFDYSNQSIEGIELIREADGQYATGPNQFNFRDVLEGFNSYVERNELPIDRSDILENVKSLEHLARENDQYDLFAGYLRAWHELLIHILDVTGNPDVSSDFREEYGTPFGKNVLQVFKKPQAMAGFGAAVGRLRDFSILQGFEDVTRNVDSISVDDGQEFVDSINRALDWIKNNTKKIGNAQRSYFHYFYREILNPDSDSYLQPDHAVETALQKYKSQYV